MSSNPGSALDRIDGIAMRHSPAEAKRRLQEFLAFVRDSMVEGVDYGVIPGTDKKTLLQPGAQKLAELYGLTHRFVPTDGVKDWERGFFYFEMKCELTSRADGSVVGEGVGSCNSKEGRYAHRWVSANDLPAGTVTAGMKKRSRQRWCFESEIPQGVDRRTLRSQERTTRDGTRKYKVYAVPGDTIDEYAIPNDDIFSLVNTLQKMACKRSLVHAVTSVTRSSGVFTQDLEDIPLEFLGVADDERPWERAERAERETAPAVAAAPAAPAPVVAEATPLAAASPAPPPAPPPPPTSSLRPVATVPTPPTKAGELTESEVKIVEELTPLFAACTTEARLKELCRQALDRSAGPSSSAPFRAWYAEMKAKGRAALGHADPAATAVSAPGPAKASGARVSTARNERAVRS